MDKSRIRNFSIIAHIDHGKTTLADRILEICNSIDKHNFRPQMLDNMELERERGITIKLNAVRLNYIDKRTNIEYEFNLIDTPGHVDFSYEVSRSLAATDGVLLVVDATQGVQSQTIANMYLALENDLVILPVINKIDVEFANIEKTKEEIETTLGIETKNVVCISAKNGINIDKLMEKVIDVIPSPKDADSEKLLKALVFDSFFDTYQGIVMFVRILNGKITKGMKLKFLQCNFEFDVVNLGVNIPKSIEKESIEAGEVGWITTNLKELKSIFVGDTLTNIAATNVEPIKGYKQSKPMVFSGFYPVDSAKFELLNDALKKISLSDSSLVYEKESSTALGFGFRIGFLGLLHVEIIKERLIREFKLDVLSTSPSVIYKITKTNGEVVFVQNPSNFPPRQMIDIVEEPYVKLSLFSPEEYLGKLIDFIHSRRGEYIQTKVVTNKIVNYIYEIPLAEIVYDFFDSIKSISKGYSSFDYEIIDYKPGNLIKLEILIKGEPVDALALIVDKTKAQFMGKMLCEKLKEIIPKHNFEIPIQAAINSKVVARETIKAYRKDVTGYLSGGDISRKKKLLEKQKQGKKKMKSIGTVELPNEVFSAVLSKK